MAAEVAGSWRDRGACFPLRHTDPDLWESFYGPTTASRKPAKAVCSGCPVRLDCLTTALDNAETWGVWGGCDEVDLRRALWLDTNGSERERRRFPRCPACRARTENLFVRLADTPRGRDSVECGACAFEWHASTSVAAVHAFWAQHRGAGEVIPLRRPGARSGQRSTAAGGDGQTAPDRDQGALED